MTLTETLQSLNQRLSRRIPTWARLLFPLVLGALLITIVVAMMYYGGKRESLMARGESAIIRWALSFAAEPAKSPNRVVSISVADSDLPALQLAPQSQLTDAHIREYAAMVEQVAATNPEWIVISWLTYAHPISEEYLKPLTDAIDKTGIRDKVTLAVNFYASGTISPDLIATYNIVEARDCYYEVNLFCTVAPDWTWMPQQVINRFFREQKPWHVSTNLPHTLPNVLLNLPAAGTIEQHTFLDLRPPVMAEIAPGSVVFIGNATSQSLQFRDNKDAIQRTFIASSEPRRTLLKDGMPWHVFWASMAEMFIGAKTIAVVPQSYVMLAIGLIAAAIITSIRFFGGGALAPFFICALGLPLANMIGARWFHTYVPVMPMIVAGLVIFTAATFISVAFSSYKKWRLQAAGELAESTADIKQNFIHLISHNLNTPIAQLTGLLELLNSSSPEDRGIGKASRLLEYVRLTVQCVLNTTTMANQDIVIAEQSIRKFFQDFLETEGVFFRRTNTSVTVIPDEEDEDKGDIWFYKFMVDRAFVSKTLIFSALSICLRHSTSDIEIHVASVNDEPADPQGLILTIAPRASDTAAEIPDRSFAIDAVRRFLVMMEGRGIVAVDDNGSSIRLTFRQSGPG